MPIDTHVHTIHSDGTESPAEVLRLAAGSGIDLVSITDHDRVKAYPEAIRLGRQHGVKVVPGVEITTKDEPGCTCIHIVGLGIDIVPEVSRVLDRSVIAQDRANLAFLDNVNDHLSSKFPSWQPVAGIKPSIFVNAMQTAKTCGIRMTEKDMMDIVLNHDLWVPVEFEITVNEAVAYIKKWGGVPVLAHPFDFSNDASLVLKRFLAAGGEGVELCKYRHKVRSSALSELSQDGLLAKEREMNLWTAEQARKHGLKLTMASDHHDASRPMGMDPAEYGIDVGWLYNL
jgi:predicted metal-dependent phosphoesterase TrpH